MNLDLITSFSFGVILFDLFQHEDLVEEFSLGLGKTTFRDAVASPLVGNYEGIFHMRGELRVS